MSRQELALLCVLVLLLVAHEVSAFVTVAHTCAVSAIARTNTQHGITRETALFSHRPQFKIIKKIMHRRPKKKRPSDINRNNVNLNKCIEKWPNAPPEYTIRRGDEIIKYMELSRQMWENGSPSDPFYTLTEEDMNISGLVNFEPTPGALKKPKFLPKSGSAAHFIPVEDGPKAEITYEEGMKTK